MSNSTVSVVITCFNQGRFLSDAINSVLRQSRRCEEIIVIDDGSTDNTREIACGYERVRYVYQSNGGLAAARNTGLRISTGDYLIYLDADDVLEQGAAWIGAAHLDAHQDWAFVSGGHRRVAADLTQIGEDCCWPVHADHYKALLRANYIGMHAAVMYRRVVLDASGGFNQALRACEDYDLYLRITRTYPVGSHGEVTASYRQHDQNMSRDPELMLDSALQVLRSQYDYVKNDAALRAAYRIGIRNWWEYFGDSILRDFRSGFPATLADGSQIRRLGRVLWNYPYVRRWLRGSRLHPARLIGSIRASLHRPQKTAVRPLEFGSFRSLVPLGEADGSSSIVGWYCRDFLDRNRQAITDDVLEIGSPGCPLSCIAELESESRCSVLCVLQLQSFDLAGTISHLYRILKPSGVLLAVVPGVVMKSNTACEEDYWRFTGRVAQRLFAPCFGDDVEVATCGNAVTSLAALHRLPACSLDSHEFTVADPQYQLLVTVRATRR